MARVLQEKSDEIPRDQRSNGYRVKGKYFGNDARLLLRNSVLFGGPRQ